MRIEIYGKGMQITDEIRDTLEKKLSKFNRYFAEDTPVYATFRREGNRQSLEITIPLGSTRIRAEMSDYKLPVVIDKVIDRIQGQLRKHKTKLQRHYGEEFKSRDFHIDLIEPVDEEEQEFVRRKKVELTPMNPEEAALQMDLIGHTFFVFLNADTNDINVVYKRKDGNYGLIEPYITD